MVFLAIFSASPGLRPCLVAGLSFFRNLRNAFTAVAKANIGSFLVRAWLRSNFEKNAKGGMATW